MQPGNKIFLVLVFKNRHLQYMSEKRNYVKIKYFLKSKLTQNTFILAGSLKFYEHKDS